MAKKCYVGVGGEELSREEIFSPILDRTFWSSNTRPTWNGIEYVFSDGDNQTDEFLRKFVGNGPTSTTNGYWDNEAGLYYYRESAGARKVKKIYIGQDTWITADTWLPKARKVKKAYVGVGGKARPFWSEESFSYYSNSIGTLTYLSTLRKFRKNFAVIDNGNYALFAGGSGDSDEASTKINTVDAFNTSLTKSNPITLGSARGYLGQSQVGDYIIFAGGRTAYSTISSYTDGFDSSLTKKTMSNLSTTRFNPLCSYNDNYAIFVGGNQTETSYRNTVDAFNSSLTRTSSTVSAATFTYSPNSSGVQFGNYAFIGGDYTNTCMTFDNSLTQTIRSIPNNTTYGAVSKVGDYIIIISSSYAQAINSSFTVTQITLPETTSGVIRTMVTTKDNDYCLYYGTTSTIGGNSKVDAYDKSLTLSTPIQLNYGRNGAELITVGNYILLGGGQTSGTVTDSNGLNVEAILYS